MTSSFTYDDSEETAGFWFELDFDKKSEIESIIISCNDD